jgi:reprolysin-like metallo-peptidase family M12B/K319-like protein
MTRRIPSPPGRAVLCAALLGLLPVGAAAQDRTAADGAALWQDVDARALGADDGARMITPGRFRTLRLDTGALQALLERAPRELSDAARAESVVLALPLPQGGFQRFRIEDSPIMEDALAAEFPELRTFKGQGLDDPTATVRFDWTPSGFHAMVLSARGTLFVDPRSKGDDTHYVAYDKKDYERSQKFDFRCGVTGEPLKEDAGIHKEDAGVHKEGVALAPGGTLQTYRLALAATGEYTAFHGGTVAGAMSAIVTTMNRVNGVYERDLAVRMVLVANNSSVVYTNASTDPYTNNNGSTMLGQNQTNLNSVIGSGNYDIGHVFSTGGGGIAGLGVVCSGSKAQGVTGSSAPIGDGFDIDYVAHEMGHQFGGNHTFNGTTGSCGGGNRSAGAAYEPGSGSTIMPYAGICGAEDLQPHSDDYFHSKSLLEISAFLGAGGASCDAASATGNTVPTVDAGASFTIPRSTPFTLTATGSDADGDTVTFAWEQYDLGTASPPNTDNGNRPIFRSFNPTTSPSRTFPKLSDILNNVATLGESLPTTTRTMTFRVTARDNRSGGGGFSTDTTTVTSRADAGPFVVTAPNTNVSWPVGSTQTVTWDVANTAAAPVSAANVRILLSTNGGTSFPTVLAASTPNDGSQAVVIPAGTTTTARIKVEAVGNIFFDVSNANFQITPGGGGNLPPTANAGPDQAVNAGATVTLSGSGSDPDSGPSPLTFAWTQVSGPSVTINNAGQATASATLATAATYVFQLAVSDGAASATDTVSIVASTVGGGATATFDAALQAPRCSSVSISCDSGPSLLLGRGTVGPEPNQPNTIADSCADGTSGTFHSDESNDRIKVSTVDGTNFAAGKTVRIDATVWAWTTPSQDALDLYYTSNANTPSWTFLATIVPPTAGAQTLGATYTLPSGALQAVRARFRYQGSAAACATGGYIDHDDLVFAVTGTPTTTVFEDTFETALGWTTNPSGTDTATTGFWERGDPEATTDSGAKQLGTTVSGTNDLVTARLAGASAGANDLDGGVTSIRSPAITLPATGTLTLTFSYYLAHGTNSSTADFLRVSVVGTTTSVVLQELGAADNDNGAWATATASLNAFAGQTVRILIEAADASTASLVEAGIDDVKITQE